MISRLKDSILESPLGYRLWSAPLIAPKIAAINSLLQKAGKTQGRFLDVGCGPGSNSPFFGAYFNYLGVDINPAYIQQAQHKHPSMKFAVADATALALEGLAFDVVLMNSLIHHLDDSGARTLLESLRPQLNPGGVVIAQEPLIPQQGEWFKHRLMRADRGKYFRQLTAWHQLYTSSGYTIAAEEYYTIRLLGVPGWNMCSTMLVSSPHAANTPANSNLR
jgi:SAM-dependent methyltransferase